MLCKPPSSSRPLKSVSPVGTFHHQALNGRAPGIFGSQNWKVVRTPSCGRFWTSLYENPNEKEPNNVVDVLRPEQIQMLRYVFFSKKRKIVIVLLKYSLDMLGHFQKYSKSDLSDVKMWAPVRHLLALPQLLAWLMTPWPSRRSNVEPTEFLPGMAAMVSRLWYKKSLIRNHQPRHLMILRMKLLVRFPTLSLYSLCHRTSTNGSEWNPMFRNFSSLSKLAFQNDDHLRSFNYSKMIVQYPTAHNMRDHLRRLNLRGTQPNRCFQPNTAAAITSFHGMLTRWT